MKIPELLAPAGSRASLRGAVASGCDAVYLGGRRFNARGNADNFGEDELEDIIDYCHVRGVLVYITVNTLYGDNEIRDVADFCEKAYKAGADALIMQDIGAAFFIRQNFPGIKLIASTQMTIGDSLGAKILSKIFDRIIVAREASLDTIRDIVANNTVETEAFVHGALCVCHSGQCLMSSMIGGRSGNRGRCAQPCRLGYELMVRGKSEAKGYLLSPRDLCTLEMLPEIVNTGIDSLKIEGRMKSPEYVALTTKIYRQRLDAIASGDTRLDPSAQDKLLRVFNRGGTFTEGYFKSHGGADMMSFATPKNTGVYIGAIESCRPASKKAAFHTLRDLVPGDGIEVWTKTEPHAGTYINKEYKAKERAVIDIEGRLNIGDEVYQTFDKRLMDSVGSAREDMGKITVDAYVCAMTDKPIRLELKYRDIRIITEGAVCEPAEKHPTTAADIEGRLRKTGQTTFVFNFVDIKASDGIYISIKDLNELRRLASEALTKEIIKSSRREGFLRQDTDKSVCSISNEMVYNSGDGLKGEASRGGYRRPVLSMLCANHEQLEKVVEGFANSKAIPHTGDNIIFEPCITPSEASNALINGSISKTLLKARSIGLRVYAALPRVISGNIGLYSKCIDVLPPVDGFLLRNFGQLQFMNEYCKNNREFELLADFSFNAFNALTTVLLQKMGFSKVTLSPELDLESLRRIATQNVEIIIHGRLPLMVTNQCPIGNQYETRHIYCPRRGDNAVYSLRDGLGLEFPILTDCENCIAQIFNSKPVFTLNKLNELLSSGVGRFRLNFTTESASDAAVITYAYKTALDRGYADERLSQKIRGIYDMGVTNGHFFRGVL